MKTFFFETRINPINGKERWIELNMKRVDIENGDMVIAIARDITQRKKHIATIEYKSNYDNLTNLPNRNYLVNFILEEKSPSHYKIDSLTLICIDLDRFKEINESMGQQTGDVVLQKIANRLNRVTDHTSNELLVRLEGDEFMFILPDTEIDSAMNFAFRIKQIIAEPLYIGSKKISIDCSMGISNFPEHTRKTSISSVCRISHVFCKVQ